MLDAMDELADHAGSGIEGYLERLADLGVDFVQRDAEHFELRQRSSPSWRSRERVSSRPHASLIRPPTTRKM